MRTTLFTPSAKQGLHDAQTQRIALAMRPPQLEKSLPGAPAPSSTSADNCVHGKCNAYSLLRLLAVAQRRDARNLLSFCTHL